MKEVCWTIAAVAALAGGGCNRIDASEENSGSRVGVVNRIDSILPSGEALRRFTAGLSPVTDLSDASPSRDELVSRFLSALAGADTASLAKMVVSRAEYAFLYYPSSVYARKPYELAPDLAWMLNEQNSSKGLSRLLTRLGAKKLQFLGYQCPAPVREAENSFWRDCRVTYREPGKTEGVERQLFSVIMERRGKYKILSYANDF